LVFTALAMARPDDSVRPVERLATWLVTGPLGHFVAGVLDWAELLGKFARRALSTRAARRR